MPAPTNWSDAQAPTLDDIERLAVAAWNRLPDYVRRTCGDLVIRIDEFAADEVLDGMGIESPFELMGLYQGVSMDRRSTGDLPREPDMVFLYRRALLDYWSEAGDETLGDLVTHVLVHEIGHHFGFSDDDMDAIETSLTDP
ncbi:MAG: metallopeptidase family protein [Hyphomicrobiaceae bacterium]|nr:metallopeptidase family protein [Hyphomicrobiaceae bacterium]MCC0007893.1 metallopeptidase family protein [Hyphomicrobiaceae bacterium]